MVSNAVVVLVDLLFNLVLMGTRPLIRSVMLGLCFVVSVTVNNVSIVRPWCTLSLSDVRLFRRLLSSLSENLSLGAPVAVAIMLPMLTV